MKPDLQPNLQLLDLLEVCPAADAELFETLVSGPHGLRIERIVSTGQNSPPDFWYDQNEVEWVLLLQGRAGLLCEGQPEITLEPGHSLLIPAFCRHRVTFTQADPPTIWLAVFWSEPGPRPNAT